jgi:two-component system response regulator QseB
MNVDRVLDAADRPAVLVVEDDRELREMLDRLLTEAGYQVDTAADGHSGLHAALTRTYDSIILDRGLPAVDGVDLTRRLRRQGHRTPIMILTAYGSVADRVEGLDAGAEDYLVKPFEVDELLARVRALIRRQQSTGDQLTIGAGRVDLTARVAHRPDGSRVDLSGREIALLRTLANRPGRAFSRDELRGSVFDAAESATIVDTYVHYLRRKLGNRVVRTVRGVGYRIGEM